MGRSGFQSLNLESCIDAGYPVTSRFDLISEFDVRAAYTPKLEDLESFLADPAASWAPYSVGMPHDRHSDYERSLRNLLDAFRKQGPAASCTAWIPAEDGSGATTLLRQLTFNCAREGYPVLLAKRNADAFDFKQITAFLTVAARKAGELDSISADVPWVIAFDAEHMQLHREVIAGLCNGLKRLMRPVLVLAIMPTAAETDESWQRAAGTNRNLGPRLRNAITRAEADALGQHLNRFLPSHLQRSRNEWDQFQTDVVRIDVKGGSRSLFWVALRFWLFRLQGTQGPFREFLARKLDGIVNGNTDLLAGLLEVAVLAKNRLFMPVMLLEPNVRQQVTILCRDSTNSLGILETMFGTTSAVTYSHPLIAEELLRIAKDDDASLAAVAKGECLNLLDLELHLMERLFRREAVGRKDCVPIVEELVTSALRVDERDAPRNFEVRDRIVRLLETAPDSLWDASQVFNHHVAKGRRHLAMKPPFGDPYWTEETIREQLQLAENHLVDALTKIIPAEEERRESPLNLNVSLAVTYDARAKKEAEWGHQEIAAQYQGQADQAFRQAQSLDGDNTYVLENYARFMLYQAKQLDPGESRTKLLVDAISLLERERAVDELASRASPVIEELTKAMNCLKEGSGERILHELAAKGSEAGIVALAKLELAPNDNDDTVDEAALAEAERLLRTVPAPAKTWRSISALYRIVARSRPTALLERHELLEELRAADYVWPLQLRFERAILLHQLGKHTIAQREFTSIRDDLPSKSSPLRIPEELRFLADPASSYTEPLITSLIVQESSMTGRNLWGIPLGWGSCRVPFRPYMFNRDVFRVGAEIECLIQFTNFGPQAVPPTENGTAP